MDYKNVIPKRKSIRDYKEVEVDSKVRENLKEFYKDERKLIDNIELEVLIKNKSEVYDKLKDIAGYHDFMIEAPHYLIILSEDKENKFENTGYVGENIILKAWEQGVGSCWITFKNEEEIKNKLEITSDKVLTGLIAFGFDDNKTKVVYENVSVYNPTRADIAVVEDNISSRLGVETIVYLNEWENNATSEDLSSLGLLDAFHYVRFAPSYTNRQPWRFIVDNGMVILTIKKENEYVEGIEAGAIMLYFDVIVDTTMFDAKWIIGKPKKEYRIPEDYRVVAYCNM